MLKVKLSSCGNPDYRQSDILSPEKQVNIMTLAEASVVCGEYISKWNLGGGNWNGGQVFDESQQIAWVSYNGRIWDMQGNEIT